MDTRSFPLGMDQSLRTAARNGNVSDLYTLIQSDGNVLRHLDEIEFIDTPLHIAAEEGCMRFAMEMMNLKPSFARKLNQGLSPIHVALEKGHTDKVGNCDDLLDKFLEACSDCIRDVTTQNHTALHIAVENRRLDVLQVLIKMLKKKYYCEEVVNRKDEDGNTALHLAASNNQPQMLKLLLSCKADKHATNQSCLTALDVAQQHNHEDSISALRGCSFIPVVSNFKPMLEKKVANYVTKASSLIFRDMDNISGDDRNALLVILGLLLTATYQATLSPPGGISPGGKSLNKPGKSYTISDVMRCDKSNQSFAYVEDLESFMTSDLMRRAMSNQSFDSQEDSENFDSQEDTNLMPPFSV
ncbi:hypothetical protein V6N11_028351 [Hibiscus sabdariffa]|uniref:Uncharacterized protein n=1 Tax=Hibiscus sabdariffa TaxID=183260 RepID=A0ABR2NQL0_9ROSI